MSTVSLQASPFNLDPAPVPAPDAQYLARPSGHPAELPAEAEESSEWYGVACAIEIADDSLRADMESAHRELAATFPGVPSKIHRVQSYEEACGAGMIFETCFVIDLRHPIYLTATGDSISEAVANVIAKATTPKAA